MCSTGATSALSCCLYLCRYTVHSQSARFGRIEWPWAIASARGSAGEWPSEWALGRKCMGGRAGECRWVATGRRRGGHHAEGSRKPSWSWVPRFRAHGSLAEDSAVVDDCEPVTGSLSFIHCERHWLLSLRQQATGSISSLLLPRQQSACHIVALTVQWRRRGLRRCGRTDTFVSARRCDTTGQGASPLRVDVLAFLGDDWCVLMLLRHDHVLADAWRLRGSCGHIVIDEWAVLTTRPPCCPRPPPPARR